MGLNWQLKETADHYLSSLTGEQRQQRGWEGIFFNFPIKVEFLSFTELVSIPLSPDDELGKSQKANQPSAIYFLCLIYL